MILLYLILLGAAIGFVVKGRIADTLLGALGALEGGYIVLLTAGSSASLLIFLSALCGALLFLVLQRAFSKTPSGISDQYTQ